MILCQFSTAGKHQKVDHSHSSHLKPALLKDHYDNQQKIQMVYTKIEKPTELGPRDPTQGTVPKLRSLSMDPDMDPPRGDPCVSYSKSKSTDENTGSWLVLRRVNKPAGTL